MENQFQKLKNQPITMVLAEFRFSKVMKIGDKIPEIQEALRGVYPLFEEKIEQVIETLPSGVRVNPAAAIWVFGDADNKKAVMIDTSRVVVFSTIYDRFPAFQAECEDILGIIQDVVKPGLLLRVGLRYNDSVVPEQGETLDQYIESPWIPPKTLVKSVGDGLLCHKEETVVKTKVGTLSVRTIIGHNHLTVMPDIMDAAPISIEAISPADQLTAILDFDQFWAAGKISIVFKKDVAVEILSKLHKGTRQAFWDITTEYARSVKWG